MLADTAAEAVDSRTVKYLLKAELKKMQKEGEEAQLALTQLEQLFGPGGPLRQPLLEEEEARPVKRTGRRKGRESFPNLLPHALSALGNDILVRAPCLPVHVWYLRAA